MGHMLITGCLLDYVMPLLLFKDACCLYFLDMIEEIMEVFIDDFTVYGKTFDDCLENWDKVLQRCEEKDLVLNWEKYYFMVREGIVLGHLINVESRWTELR